MFRFSAHRPAPGIDKTAATARSMRYSFGTSEDKPTVGDFDGDGKADIAVFRPSTGAWYRVNSSDGSLFGELFGYGSDIITPADYDGDGKSDLAVFLPRMVSGTSKTALPRPTQHFLSGCRRTSLSPVTMTATAGRTFRSSAPRTAHGTG